jgi:hypothetical protein
MQLPFKIDEFDYPWTRFKVYSIINFCSSIQIASTKEVADAIGKLYQIEDLNLNLR